MQATAEKVQTESVHVKPSPTVSLTQWLILFSIFGAMIVLAFLFTQWGHKATGLPKWLLVPLGLVSAYSLGIFLLESVMGLWLARKKA